MTLTASCWVMLENWNAGQSAHRIANLPSLGDAVAVMLLSLSFR
jgi:hypothetical protein